jgi:tetratricopeptide (TPR) repeat protein
VSGSDRPSEVDASSGKGVLVGDHGTQHNVFVEQRMAAAAPVALAQLPPLASGFTGRQAELAQVAKLLDPAAGSRTLVVSAVAGLAGVGKTALAVHAAHAACEAGWFAGGVLFIDLHGYDQNPVQPGQALDALLRALGVPGEHIPEAAEQRAGLYRSALAQVSDPVLVVADNASAEAQVRPLIPGPGPHRVIITSRHTLAGLGARLLDVAVLDQAEAVSLLDKVVRVARPDDDRIGGDPATAGRLAGSCGGLPLALQIAAALLAADPVLSAAELADQMADEVQRLETLRYDDGSGVSTPSVAAAFELSYRQLDEDAARMFRLLPADPGSDVSTQAAAELTGWPTDQARAAISRLARAHLIEEGGARGRWRMHDLLRLYARHIPEVNPGEREQALDRVLTWYLNQVQAADRHLRALAGSPVPMEFIGRDDALAWLDDQRPNLIAAVTMAAAVGRHREAMSLPLFLSVYLNWRRRFDDSLVVMAVSLNSARQLNHKSNEASALTGMGRALGEMRGFEEAISAYQDAAAIYRETGDRRGDSITLNSLGIMRRNLRRFEEAISDHQGAAAISREIGDLQGEGIALSNLGGALLESRQVEEAAQAYEAATAIFREVGDRHGEGLGLTGLGLARRHARRFEEAVSDHQDAVAIFREISDRHGEGVALGNLGGALLESRQVEEAAQAYEAATAIFRETSDRYGEGKALTGLGLARQDARRFEEAVSAHQDAVAIFREISDRYGEGEALSNLGHALKALLRFDEAIGTLQDAVAIYRETGDRRGEDIALSGLEESQAARSAESETR